ncbi:ferredoxin [Lentzea sp. NBRC 105346]|uniref:ferredoxin n=1 Tax=Lentzea sp. NBRC 105346 TaxID=3032205 RepID=UPI00255550CF|nr:ferredoxin [Lentzea sp. NBRC 105346]GLZ33910.1 ferredoxin [Lentzea sp. NBRC 105346]
MRISVDQTRCCGSGMCVLTDPELFDQSEEDGTVVLLEPNPSAEHEATAKEAAGLCPAGAITVTD